MLRHPICHLLLVHKLLFRVSVIGNDQQQSRCQIVFQKGVPPPNEQVAPSAYVSRRFVLPQRVDISCMKIKSIPSADLRLCVSHHKVNVYLFAASTAVLPPQPGPVYTWSDVSWGDPNLRKC